MDFGCNWLTGQNPFSIQNRRMDDLRADMLNSDWIDDLAKIRLESFYEAGDGIPLSVARYSQLFWRYNR